MNLIDQTFQRLRSEGRTALIPFLTVGDPNLDTTAAIIQELEAAGADAIELGVPYSDPLADGPVIQRASGRALANGIALEDCIGTARTARAAGVKLPFILFSYFNPVLQFGLERFFARLAECDISGVILPDLPLEEAADVKLLSEQAGIHLIPLVAPTSSDRVTRIAAQASGFVYCVSSLGVTGVRSEFHQGIEDFIRTVKSATSLPVAIGFGISSKEQFDRFSGLCDGVIVGSAIVRTIEDALPLLAEEGTKAEGLARIREFAAHFKGQTDTVKQ